MMIQGIVSAFENDQPPKKVFQPKVGPYALVEGIFVKDHGRVFGINGITEGIIARAEPRIPELCFPTGQELDLCSESQNLLLAIASPD